MGTIQDFFFGGGDRKCSFKYFLTFIVNIWGISLLLNCDFFPKFGGGADAS
jgi:hypothetical protein